MITNTQTISGFRSELLRGVYEGHYRCLDDNFDFFRFGFDADPNFVYYDQHVAYLDFALSNLESFFAASFMFADSASRDLFIRLMKYRCLGAPHQRIRDDLTWTSVQQMFDNAAQYEVGPSSNPLQGMFGPLSHFENIPTDGEPIDLDGWRGNIASGIGHGKIRQYFFERDGLSIGPRPGDWIIDAGACFGDTGAFFARVAGPDGRVYCFDPLPAHQEVITLNIEQNKLQDMMFVVPKGVGDQTNDVSEVATSLSEISSPGFSLLAVDAANAVPVTTIDDFATHQQLEKIDFIKMDIEGFELAALRGAFNSIARFRPRLAISLYHKPEDFFEIPIYLKTNFPFYRFYLDHYTIFQEETVLYAIAN